MGMSGKKTNGDSISRFIKFFGSYLAIVIMVMMLVAVGVADSRGQLPEGTSELTAAIAAIILSAVALIISLVQLFGARKQAKDLRAGIKKRSLEDIEVLKDAVAWLWEHPILTAIFVAIVAIIAVYYPNNPDNAQAAAAGLAVIALIIALVQLADARKQSDNLKTISQEMYTQHRGEFPLFLREITELIRDANTELIISCDFPAYGALSGGEDFRKYKEAIENKKGNMDLRFIYLETKERKGVLDRQFNDDDDEGIGGWEKWKKIPKKEELLKEFFKEHGPEDLKEFLRQHLPEGKEISENISAKNISGEHISFNAFKECFDSYNAKVLQETFDGFSIRKEIPHRMPVYFWICDGIKAFFTIVGGVSGGGEKEFGFRTIDPRLIDTFKNLFRSYNEGTGRRSTVAVCLDNKGYEAFEVGKLYRVIPDAEAEHGYKGVVDESRTKYDYSDKHFHPVELPSTVEQALPLSPDGTLHRTRL